MIIRPLPERLPAVERLFAPLDRAMADLCSAYSDQELALIRAFASRANAVVHEETAKLRQEAAPTRKPGRGGRTHPR